MKCGLILKQRSHLGEMQEIQPALDCFLSPPFSLDKCGIISYMVNWEVVKNITGTVLAVILITVGPFLYALVALLLIYLLSFLVS